MSISVSSFSDNSLSLLNSSIKTLKTSKISDPTNINKNISIANLPKQITLEEIYDYGKELEQLFPESSETDDLEL